MREKGGKKGYNEGPEARVPVSQKNQNILPKMHVQANTAQIFKSHALFALEWVYAYFLIFFQLDTVSRKIRSRARTKHEVSMTRRKKKRFASGPLIQQEKFDFQLCNQMCLTLLRHVTNK